jgi:hypothetical protein
MKSKTTTKKGRVFVDKPEKVEVAERPPVKSRPVPAQAVPGKTGSYAGTAQVGTDAAEKAREAAFNGDGYRWKDLELVGLTSGRWSLFVQQRAAVTDLPFLDALAGDGWFADAVRILYFCATGPDVWAEYRRNSLKWQEAIEEWSNQHIEISERVAVELLAFQIYQDANVNRHVVAAPEKGASTGGN